MRTAPDYAIEDLDHGAPDAPAIVHGEETATYAELDRAANQVANGLIALGLDRDDRVAFVGRNGLPCVEVLIGAARAGVVLTIVNWRLHPRELAYVLRDCQARVVVVTDEFVDVVDRLAADLATDLGVERTIRVAQVAGSPGDEWSGWLASQSTDAPPQRRAPDDVVLQLYTSGTTGQPKGAMLTRASFAATIPDTADFWHVDASSVVLSVLPMFHIAGVGTALATLWSGASLVIDNDPQPASMLATIAEHRVTNLVLASVMLQGLVASPLGPTTDVSTLRTISYGAAPISGQVLQEAIATFGCRLVQAYGLTETTGILTVLDAADHDFDPDDPIAAARLRSCGRPRSNVELRIVDAASNRQLPPGEVGEVLARTPRLMAGYWNRGDATEEVMLPDGWFRSGDLGELDGDGYLFLRDRLKDTIVSGGENIYPAEVEDALQWHPDVREVAVVGIPDDRWGETPRAVVVVEPGSATTDQELIAFARDRLARYKCPTSVTFVDALPRNATGKVLRREVREPYWVGRTRRIN